MQGRSSAAAYRRLLGPGGVLVAILAMAMCAAPAGASETHLFEGVFGSAAQPSFANPQGLAVDQGSGQVLVMDSGTIQRFNADGTPATFAALGTNTIDGQGGGNCATVPADCDQTPENGLGFGGPGESQIAVDDSGGATDGNIYVTQSSPNVVNVFSEEGEYLGRLTAAGATPFNEACGVAVDPSGAVYVGDYGAGIHKFVPAANPPVDADHTASFTGVTNPCTLAAGAGPTAGSLFAASFFGPAYKLDSGTGAVAYTVSPKNTATLSVDPGTGHVYVAVPLGVDEYDASGAGGATAVSSFSPPSEVRGVGVRASSGEVYVTRPGAANAEVFGPLVTLPDVTTGSASAIGPTAATLNSNVNPDGVELTECLFEYGKTSAYGQTVPCEQSSAAIGSGSGDVPVSADLSGLDLGAEYHFRLVAKNANGTMEGADSAFKLQSPPVLNGEWSSTVTYTEATLNAEIDPEGSPTTYRFEWGPTAAYGSNTPPSGLGSSDAIQVGSASLEGLQPATTYHYRAVATNSLGTTTGADHTFLTYAVDTADTDCPNQVFRVGSSATLPDCRAYEMVSPVDKNGGDVSISPSDPVHASPFGIEGLAQSSVSGERMTYHSFTAFGDAVSSPITGTQYLATRTAAGWSTRAITPPRGQSVFSPGKSTRLGYKLFNADLSAGWMMYDSTPLSPEAPAGFANLYRRDSLSGAYQPMVTSTPPNGEPLDFRPVLEGLADDESHVVFKADDALTPDAPLAWPHTSLYDWTGGELHLVSIRPDGQPAETAHVGGPNQSDDSGVGGNVDNAVSADGSRIYWTDNNGYWGHLYLRVNNQETVPVSETITSEPKARYWTASEDGSKAFFTMHGNDSSQRDLYEFDLATESSTLIAHDVRGVMGVSDDASYLYFVSEEALAAGAVDGGANLYVRHGGTVELIATLGEEETEFEATTQPSVVNIQTYLRSSRVTPDGRHIAFMSNRSLTGYDHTDGETGVADAEVFLYDADAESITCVSCNPSGARPVGEPIGQHTNGVTPPSAASTLPVGENQLYVPHALSVDGNRVFFNSFDALLPEDTNGKQDVYQWERQGTGSCEAPGGCVSLISTGESPAPSEFLDATPNGDTVFITTRSSIAPQDPGLRDVYAARVGGGFPPPMEIAPCSGESCQGAAVPRPQTTPGSATYRGPGDVGRPKARKCAAHQRKVRHRASHRVAHEAKKKAGKRSKRCRGAGRRAGR